MQLNTSKFEFLSYKVHWQAPNNNMRLLKQLPFAYMGLERSYNIDHNVELLESDVVTDLGINITNSFSFTVHVNRIAKKANQKCFWILSVFTTRDAFTMLTLFKSLVRGILEYCSPFWFPSNIADIETIESIQRRFTSKINDLAHLSYWERLKKLGLMSLQRRRERYALFYMWKIHHGLVTNDLGITWDYSSRRGLLAIVPSLPCNVAKVNTIHDRSFKVIGPRLWNTLPKHINTRDTFSGFKASLDAYLMNIADCPPVAGYSRANNNSLLSRIY